MQLLRKLELKCLQEFDRICRKHGIPYFLGGGTLLGAVRHQGFIPWDDDIDVMMLPDAYARFTQIVDQELGEEFVYQSQQNDPEYYSAFDKIRLKGTVFDTYLSRQYPLKSHGIFIDIFVHDYSSNRKMMQQIHVIRTVYAKSLVLHKRHNSPMHFYGRLKLLCKAATWYKDSTPMETLKEREYRILTRYNHKHTKYLYDGRGEHTKHGVFPAWILTDGAIYTSFEGIQFPIPKHYDEYLKFSYGETYMELPPEEKRIPEHDLAVLDFGIYQNKNNL